LRIVIPRPMSEKEEKYKTLVKEVISLLPKDKAEYWIGRIAQCKTLSARMKLCEDLKKHFGGNK